MALPGTQIKAYISQVIFYKQLDLRGQKAILLYNAVKCCTKSRLQLTRGGLSKDKAVVALKRWVYYKGAHNGEILCLQPSYLRLR